MDVQKSFLAFNTDDLGIIYTILNHVLQFTNTCTSSSEGKTKNLDKERTNK